MHLLKITLPYRMVNVTRTFPPVVPGQQKNTQVLDFPITSTWAILFTVIIFL